MQLTLFTDYGLRTLMYLVRQSDKLSSVKEISEYYGVSRSHLTKVVHRLSMLGYVHTIKGKGGGIKIALGTEERKLGELIAQLEPNMDMVECFNRATNTCRIIDSCLLNHYLFQATRAFIDTMNQYTLADTIKNKTEPIAWNV